MRFQNLLIFTSLFLLFTTGVTASVNRGDMCLTSPANQCSGNQLLELGQTDSNTDGRGFDFRGNVNNPSVEGDVYLEFKDKTSTTFTEVENSPFNDIQSIQDTISFGDNPDKVDIQDGQSKTITIDGNEHTFEIFTDGVDTNNADVTFYEDGVSDILDVREYKYLDGVVYDFSNVEDVYQTFQLEDGETRTISGEDLYLGSIVDSNTIYAEVGGDPANYDVGDVFNVGGDDVRLDEVIDLGNGDGAADFTNLDNIDYSFATHTFYPPILSPEGHNEYRMRWEGDDGRTVYSDSLFFSVDQSDNLPADQEVTVDSLEVNNPETTTGVTPNSNINLQVLQQEDDPVNITLVDASNDEAITTIQGNRSSEGTFQTIFSDVTNELLSSFTDTETEGFYSFLTIGDDLMSNENTQYNFYFEIKERVTPSDTRTTKVYTVETSGDANPAPQINSVEAYNGNNWVSINNIGYGEIERIRADITDSNNEYLEVDLTYWNEYTNQSELEGFSSIDSSIGYGTKTGDYYIWDSIENNSKPGTYNLNISAYDGAAYTNTSESYNIPYSDTASIQLNNPTQDQIVNETVTSFNYTLDSPEGQVNLYLNSSKINSTTQTSRGETTYVVEEDLTNGYYEYRVEYVGDDGSTLNSSLTGFTVDAMEVTLNEPLEGAVLTDGTVNFSWSVVGVEGTTELYINDTQVSSQNYGGGSVNTSYSYTRELANGAYNWYVRYIGSGGSSIESVTRNFTVDSAEEEDPGFIEDVSIDYSPSDSATATVSLSGSEDIESRNSPDGTTTTFNNDSWVIEDLPLPYSDTLEVTGVLGRTSTYELSFDITDNGYRQDLEALNDVNEQRINETISLSNNQVQNYLIFNPSFEDLSSSIETIGSLTQQANVSSNTEETLSTEWRVDYITESRNKTVPERIQEGEEPEITLKENWTNTEDIVGFNEINNTYEMPDSESGIRFVRINGTDYLGTNLVNINNQGDIEVEWNQTIPTTTTLDPEIGYNETPVTVIENTPNQQSATIYEDVPFEEDDFIVNNGEEEYSEVEATVTIFSDARQGETTVVDEFGRSLEVNRTQNDEIEFLVRNLEAGESREVTTTYDIQNLSISEENYTTQNGALVDHFIMNMSTRGSTNFQNLEAFKEVPQPEQITTVRLYRNGTEITNNPSFDFEFVDDDGDALQERIEWTIPSIDGRQDYDIRVTRGQPLEVDSEVIVQNPPVKEGKFIEFRKGLRLFNPNDFDVEYSRRFAVPRQASNIFRNGEIVNKLIGAEGAYVPFNTTVPAQENITAYVEFSSPSIETTIDRLEPEVYWVNQENYGQTNVTFLNDLSVPVKQVSGSVNIIEANDLTAKLGNGTVIDEQSNVEGNYDVNVSRIDSSSSKTVTLDYRIPVANVTDLGQVNKTSEGDKIHAWNVASTSPVSRTPAKFNAEGIECSDATRAFNVDTNQTLQLECGEDAETVVVIGNLNNNQVIRIGVRYNDTFDVVESTGTVLSVISNNLVGLGSTLLFAILMIQGYRYREDLPVIGQ